jgi:hypothetical protein
MMLESSVERLLRNRVTAAGGICIKLLPTVAGVPDRLVLLPYGQVWLVELKAPGGRLREVQRVWHERAGKIGVPVVVLWSGAAVEEWVAARLAEI